MKRIQTQILLILNNRLLKIQAVGLLLLLPFILFALFRALDNRLNQYAESVATYRTEAEKYTDFMLYYYDDYLLEGHTGELRMNELMIQKTAHYEKGEYRQYLEKEVEAWNIYFPLREKRGSYNTSAFFPSIFDEYGEPLWEDIEHLELVINPYAKQRVAFFEGLLSVSGDIAINDIIGITARGVVFRWLGYSASDIYYPLFFFVLTLVFASPIFLDDKRHTSLLEVKPIGQLKYLLDRLMAYWLSITGLEALFLGIILGSLSITYGLGNWSLGILTFSGREEIMVSSFEFYGKAILFISLINVFLIALVAFSNRLFSSKPITVMLGVSVLFLEPILRFLDIQLSFSDLLPSHYVSFGPVLQGVKNYFFDKGDFTVAKGLTVLSLASLILLTLTYIQMVYSSQYRRERRRKWGLQR